MNHLPVLTDWLLFSSEGVNAPHFLQAIPQQIGL